MDSTDIALLTLRVVVGALIVGHGVGNLFGWFGGFGLNGTGAIFHRLGFRPGRRYAGVAGLTELGAGILLGIGLGTPLAAAGLIGLMVTTIFSAHRGKGPWYFNGGWEYNVTLLSVGNALAFAGPGWLSVDHSIGFDDGRIGWGIAALTLGLASGVAALATRRSPPVGDSTTSQAAA